MFKPNPLYLLEFELFLFHIYLLLLDLSGLNFIFILEFPLSVYQYQNRCCIHPIGLFFPKSFCFWSCWDIGTILILIVQEFDFSLNYHDCFCRPHLILSQKCWNSNPVSMKNSPYAFVEPVWTTPAIQALLFLYDFWKVFRFQVIGYPSKN